MLRLKANPTEVLMVPSTVTSILGKQKWMMYVVALPEGDAITVVFQDAVEDLALLNALVVVRIQPDKQELSFVRKHALIRAFLECFCKSDAGVWYEHRDELKTH